MGSMVKADSDRRELVRERRQARMARKRERRDARERKRVQVSTPPAAVSPIRRAAQEQVDAELDRIVTEALQRHDRDTATANLDRAVSVALAPRTIDERPTGERHVGRPPAGSQTVSASAGQRVMIETSSAAGSNERASRRERDIAVFRERRRRAADEARAEARERIARAGEIACVADALAALAHPAARAWDAERQELERALQGGRIVEVGAVARRSLWAISRDAARSSRRARRRSGSRARGLRRLRDHRAPTAKRAAQRAAHPRRRACSCGQAARVLALSGRRRGQRADRCPGSGTGRLAA